MRMLLASALALLLAGCSPEPGSTRWCKQKKEQPTTEWSVEDVGTFARYCVIDDLTIGSEAWCKNLADKPKGEWTADEAASYARHCML